MNTLAIKSISSAIACTILLGIFAALASLYLTGCTADEVTAGANAFNTVARTGLSVKDQYEHPEAYRPRFQGYNALGQPIYTAQ